MDDVIQKLREMHHAAALSAAKGQIVPGLDSVPAFRDLTAHYRKVLAVSIPDDDIELDNALPRL